MIKFKSFNSKTFALALLFLCSISCTQKSSSKSSQNILRMRLEAEPPSIDWTTATDGLSRDVIVTLHEGLVRMDKEGKIVPNFAESWKVSSNGKVFTFKLRPNLKWSDGTALVAQHFVDAVERTLTPKVASEYAYFLFDVENAENFFNAKEKSFAKVGVKAPDSNTVVYTLRSPAPYWINVPAFSVTYPVRKDLIAQLGDRWTDAGKLITAGPYQLREWIRESKLTLVKNPYYWDQEAQKKMFNEIEFRVIKENAVALTLFERKEVDIVRKLSPLQVPMLSKKEPGFTKAAYWRSMAVGFGMTNPLTKDKRVRMALSMSVDRAQIKKILSDLVEPTQSWIPEGLLGANSKRGINYDPEKAKKLWAEIPNPPLKGLEYWYPNDEMHKMVAEFLQSEWKKNLGVDVTLVAQEWKVFLKSAATQDLPIFRYGWGADYADSNNFLDMFTCSSGNNYPKYCNTAYEKLLKDALNTQKPESRSQIYSQAEKMLLEEDVAIAPIFQENNLFLVNTRLKGFAANKMGEFRLADVRFQEQN